MNATRKTHEQRLKEACEVINRLGYLRAKDLARILYPEAAESERLGRRLAKALNDKGLVIVRDDIAQGSRFYSLSEKGARLATAYTGEAVRSGKDLIRTIAAHRVAANELAVRLMAGRRVSVITEREIVTTENKYELCRKIPDVLAIDEYENEYGAKLKDYYWFEVEACRRGGRDLKDLANWVMRYAFPDKRGYLSEYRDGNLAALVLVIAVPEASTIKGRLIRELERQAAGDETTERWVKEKAQMFIKVIDLRDQSDTLKVPSC